jgi:hypothetical protein
MFERAVEMRLSSDPQALIVEFPLLLSVVLRELIAEAASDRWEAIEPVRLPIRIFPTPYWLVPVGETKYIT